MKRFVQYGALLSALAMGISIWQPSTVALVASGAGPMSGSTSTIEPSAQNSAGLYAQYCARCHGRDGKSNTSRGKKTAARNFTDAAWQNSVTDERLYNSIINGRNKMPSYENLSDAQVNALVAYVRGFKG